MRFVALATASPLSFESLSRPAHHHSKSRSLWWRFTTQYWIPCCCLGLFGIASSFSTSSTVPFFVSVLPVARRQSHPTFLPFTQTINTMPRSSSRRMANSGSSKMIAEEDPVTSPLKDANKPKAVKGTKRKKVVQAVVAEVTEEEQVSSKKKRKQPATRKSAATTTIAKKGGGSKKARASNDNNNSDGEEKPSPTKKSKPPKKEAQRLTERNQIPKLWNPEQARKNGSYTFKVASWNVAGLRAIMKKDPEALAKLAKEHDLDVLCLQETKLQESHLDDPKLKIRGFLLEKEGYDAYYSCSTVKKGYSGTACFVKRRGPGAKNKNSDIGQFFTRKDSTAEDEAPLPIDEKLLIPENISYSMGKDKHDGEGRVICMDFPLFTLVALYIPNSGQKLERLDYRTKEWDKDLLEFVKEKQTQRNVPVMWLGDLNVAHTGLEVWNDGAKHLDKQAGVTPQERASFQEQLESGFVDVFRKLHPTAKGHYSYWSQRAGNRLPNKGLRLDYFVADPCFFDENSKVIARDSYMLFDQEGSDHCPAVLELEIKP